MKRLTARWRGRALAVVAGLVAAALGASGAMAPVDDALYLAYVRSAPLASSDTTVLVAIDDRSLQTLGPWPWPRRTHAQLIDRLTAAGARGVALDVLMPEPDRDPGSDDALAQAMRANGRVVLPVHVGDAADGTPPEELLPTAPLAQAARALGHTDLRSDPGSAPSLYLRAGVATPRWPALPLALLDAGRPDLAAPASPAAGASRAWERADRVLLRFSGPAGTYQRHAYVDVLAGRVPDAVFRDRRVVIGATAAGLGHVIATPMAGTWMSAPEYLANATDTLARRAEVRALSPASGALVACLLTALMIALSLRTRPGARLLAGTLAIACTLVLSMVVVSAFRVWWGPSAAMLAIAAAMLGAMALDTRRSVDRAKFDGVTGLLSRRRFLRRLRRAIAEAADAGEPLALISVYVSSLEDYRDKHGDPEAAALLERLAKLTLAELDGARDFAGRTSDAGWVGVVVGRSDAAVDALADRLRGRHSQAGRDPQAARGELVVNVGRASLLPRVAEPWPALLRRAQAHARTTQRRPEQSRRR